LTSTQATPAASAASTTAPSLACRSAFLCALATPALRSHAMASSRSPLVALSALTHSFMGAEVRSRISFT